MGTELFGDGNILKSASGDDSPKNLNGIVYMGGLYGLWITSQQNVNIRGKNGLYGNDIANWLAYREKLRSLPHTIHQNKFQMNHRSKCEKEKHNTFKRTSLWNCNRKDSLNKIEKHYSRNVLIDHIK